MLALLQAWQAHRIAAQPQGQECRRVTLSSGPLPTQLLMSSLPSWPNSLLEAVHLLALAGPGDDIAEICGGEAKVSTICMRRHLIIRTARHCTKQRAALHIVMEGFRHSR